ncbi:MAG: helicase-associated domain-containing protein [Treponema sp.]|nr:helicase-associated domain-containing protein [Treponema sp.]
MQNMQEMKNWTDYITSLPDEKFFYIMRLYLGDIKTPFNKVRLTEQLASFVRTKKNLETIISLLNDIDVKFLTVIKMVPGIKGSIIQSFFEDEFSLSFILSRLTNLQDRLLVYTEKKQYSDEVMYRINPLMAEELEPYLNPELIFPEPVIEQTFMETPFVLSPNFLAAFISYLNVTRCGLKADGKFRKTDVANLEEIFGERISCLQFLITSFINLGLVHEGEKELVVDEKRFLQFAENPELQQYIFLAVASVMRLSRDGLRKQCQLLADTLASIPECGVTKRTFLRLSQFISGRPTNESQGKTVSRFSEMLNRARYETEASSASDAISLMDSIFDAAVEFGLLALYGESENGENVYICGSINETSFSFGNEKPKVININATSLVTLLPGLSLKDLLPFTYFMQAVKCSTVTEYEITRKSVSNGFDRGYNLERIKKILSIYASFDLPQNLIFNLDEWYNSYSSAVLYKGFVLKVSRENISMVENSPSLSIHISEKLAEGVYLLDLPVEENPASFIKACGLDFMGSVKTVEKEAEVFSLPHFSKGNIFTFGNDDVEYLEISDEIIQKVEDQFFEKLETSGLDELQIESLQARIRNHLVVSDSQLVSTSVRSEILKADGIDFHGKIHLIDAAIKNNDILELTLPGAVEADGKEIVIQIKPLKLLKNEGEAFLKYEVSTDSGIEQKSYPVSRILHIKRIRI